MKPSNILIIIVLLSGVSGCLPQNVVPEPTSTTIIQPTAPLPTTEPTNNPEPDSDLLITSDGEEISITDLMVINDLVHWAVGNRESGPELILYTSDGKQSWEDRTPPDTTLDPTRRHQAITSFVDISTAYVIYTGSNQIWTTSDAGLTWQSSSLDISGVLGGLLYTLDGNTSWAMLFSDPAGAGESQTTLYRTQDGGKTWEKMLDPLTDPSHVQSFTKTGMAFANQLYGWVTKDSHGVIVNPYLDLTRDGGRTWEVLDFPPPAEYPELFKDCGCGLFDPELTSEVAGSFRLSCNCLSAEDYPVTEFLYQSGDQGTTWSIAEINE